MVSQKNDFIKENFIIILNMFTKIIEGHTFLTIIKKN